MNTDRMAEANLRANRFADGAGGDLVAVTGLVTGFDARL
jgi:hypothetical protein